MGRCAVKMSTLCNAPALPAHDSRSRIISMSPRILRRPQLHISYTALNYAFGGPIAPREPEWIARDGVHRGSRHTAKLTHVLTVRGAADMDSPGPDGFISQ